MRRVVIVLALFLFGATTVAAQPVAVRGQPHEKSPTVARVIGIVPGAGHMYAGETGRGLLYMGGTAGLFVVGAAAMLGECMASVGPQEDCGNTTGNVVTAAILGLWGWSIYDAGRAAHRTNARLRVSHVSLALVPGDAGVSGRRSARATLGVSLALR